uniref:Biogenesis of lysosome-related organelles complex 1 subunit 7 n=1 Tax=Strongyloides papillosus TaxID=174720 RepID=A0A0N5C1D0_STREA
MENFESFDDIVESLRKSIQKMTDLQELVEKKIETMRMHMNYISEEANRVSAEFQGKLDSNLHYCSTIVERQYNILQRLKDLLLELNSIVPCESSEDDF